MRDDPFLFADFLLVSEAKNMAGQYNIVFSPGMIGCIIGTILMVIGLHFVKKKIVLRQLRWGLLFVTLLMSGISYKAIYCNNKLYESIENYDVVGRWGDTQRFVSRGFIYPFIYSIQEAFPEKPDGYNAKSAKEYMQEYEYVNIPEEKKVNIIGIMLEAYNDFSKYEWIEFESNPYEKYHKIKAQSYSGELTTNIFAGGTINTERSFLTGYTNIPAMRGNTNTYVQYFKEQGYRTLGRHQYHGWFYNRKNVNLNMGFENYWFYEEGYSEHELTYLARYGDSMFVEDIISDYEDIISSGDKCFHFSVTYQNHGPYYYGEGFDVSYLKWKDEYDEEGYAIANTYFNGIARTGEAIEYLINYFQEEEEPVVVVLFGDHNPWMGDNNSVYEMLGINLDLSTEEGFNNYYNTPYLIWGNTSAKETLNTEFSGEGTTISPCFLMNELFDLIGYEGNEYMQYTSEWYRDIPVMQSNAYVENGIFVRELTRESTQIVDDFNKLQYYWIYDKK